MKLHFKKSTVRIFLITLLVLMPVIIPFIMLLSSQFSRYAFDEVNNFNQDKVNQVGKNMDFFLNNLKSYGFSIYNDVDVQNWFYSNNDEAISKLAAQNSVSRYMSLQPYIYSCYLVNMQKQYILDVTLHNNNPNATTVSSSIDTFQDKDILKSIMGEEGAYLHYFNHTVDNKSYLTLVYPSSPSRQDYYGYVVMLIDKDLLRSFYLSSSKDSGNEMFITDSKGEIILGSEGINEKPVINESDINTPNNSMEITYKGLLWSANYAKFQSQDWTIYSMNQLQTLNRKITFFQNRILFYFLMFSVVLVIVIFWISLRSYKPLDKLAEQIRQRMGKGQNSSDNNILSLRSDLKLLQNDFQSYLDRMDKVNEEMRNHRDLIREENIRQWVLQGRLDKTLEGWFNSESSLLKSEYLYMLAVRIDSYKAFCESNDFTSRKLLKFGMGNIANELLCGDGWVSECVDLGSDHIVLIIGCNQEITPAHLSEIKNIGDQINKWLKVSTSIACSKNFSVNDDLRRVYDEVLELTMLKFIRGQDKVYLEEDYEELMKNQQPIPDVDVLENIVNSIRLSKSDSIASQLDKLFGHMGNLNYETCKLQLTYIVYTIVKAFSMVSEIKEIENVEISIEKFSTIYEFRNWFEKLLYSISESINSERTSVRKEEIASEIVEYVKDHINDPMLTQEEIAIHLSLSYSYVRSIFKKVYNVTLADYILNERINMVKALLGNSDLSIMDIAQRSGFQTKSHFYTVFKKEVGLTPNEFRIKIRNSEEAI